MGNRKSAAAGYPEATDTSGFSLLYKTHTGVIQQLRNTLRDELMNVTIPIISVNTPLPGFFSGGGSAIYARPSGGEITSRLDMNNYIDYLIVNTYAHNTDWPHKNWRAARANNVTGARWRMITWDAEFCLREGTVGTDSLIGITGSALRVDGGIATFHRRLRNYQPYRDAFRARMDVHFKSATGVRRLTGAVHNASNLFQQAQNRFLPVLYSESARWGYMDTGSGAPFTRDAGLPGTAISGDWTAATRYVRENWLVNRRTPYLNAMQAAGLYTP